MVDGTLISSVTIFQERIAHSQLVRTTNDLPPLPVDRLTVVGFSLVRFQYCYILLNSPTLEVHSARSNRTILCDIISRPKDQQSSEQLEIKRQLAVTVIFHRDKGTFTSRISHSWFKEAVNKSCSLPIQETRQCDDDWSDFTQIQYSIWMGVEKAIILNYAMFLS